MTPPSFKHTVASALFGTKQCPFFAPRLKHRLRFWACAASVACAGLTNSAQAQVLLQENFNFTGLLTNNGWVGFSGTANFLSAGSPSLVYAGLPSSGTGNSAGITNTGQDAYKLLNSNNNTGDIYTSFLVNVASAGTGDYFYSLYSTNNSGGGYYTRLFAQTNSSGFSFGISRNQSTNSLVSYETNVRSFNTTYMVVAKMARVPGSSNDLVSLWVNPALGSPEPSPLATNNSGADNTNSISALALRQGTTTPGARVGNILVGTSWSSVTPVANTPAIVPFGSYAPFSTFAGTASASQGAVSVVGTNLTSAILVTAPTGIQVSADNSIFSSTANLPATGGTIYARVSASAPVGVIDSTITLSSTGATDQAVAVTALVRPTSISLPYGPDTFTTNSFPWYSYTVAGTKSWTRITSGGNSFMEINGFDAASNAVTANAWLILGPFNVSGGASNVVAQFNTQRAFTNGSDTEFNFKFSTNYAGEGDPSSAGWSDIAFNKPAPVTNSASTDFSPSGAVPLPSSVAGQTNVYVAYQLQAASTTNTSRWRVDDFELFTSSLPVISLIVNPSNIEEGSGATGSVTLPGIPASDVNVTVTSADPALLQIEGAASAVVTVPGGANPPVASFSVTTTRDWVVAPNQQVQVTADGGAAYEFGQALVTVKNVDVPSASLTAGGYTQDFSSFTNQASLPVGWSLIASSSFTNYSAWGITDAGPKFSAATTSVFGYQHTSSTGTNQQIVTLRNETGSTLTDILVSYRGRMTRSAETRYPSYTVSAGGFSVPALTYSTGEGDDILCQANISGLNVGTNETFQIVWTSDRGVNTGTSRQIGLGNLSVTTGSAPLPPSVRSLTIPPASIGQTSASAEANVVADQGSAITARGFVYSLTSVNPDPSVGGTGVVNVTDAFAEVGPMNAVLTGLAPGAQYSVKAYASNANGTAYTAVSVFTTLSTPIAFAGTYAEAFNDFTSTTSPSLSAGAVKPGWTAISSGGIQTYSGAWSSGSTTGGFYGGVSNPGALGYQPTTSTGTLTVTCRMVNNTGSPLTQLYVRYLGRVALPANTRIPTWAVTVAGVAAPALDYSTSGGADATKSALVTGLSIPVGSEFTITWTSDQGTGTGSFRRIGLADLIVSTSPIPAATISVSGVLSPFSTVVGTASASQFFGASGTGISGDITVTAPTNYQVSLNDSAFASSVTLRSTNGTVGSTTIYARIAATAAVGSPAGNIALSSSGATVQNVAVTGTVSQAGSTFTSWAGGAPLNSANLLLYAIGGASSPTATNGVASTTALTSSNLSITAVVRTNDAALSTLGYALTNLGTGPWATNGVTMTPAASQTGVPEGCQMQIFSTPRDTDAAKFLRLQSTLTNQ